MWKITIHKNRIGIYAAYCIWFLLMMIGLAAAFDNAITGESNYSDGMWYLLLDLLCLAYIFLTSRVEYDSLVGSSLLLLLVQLLGMLISGTSSIAIMTMRTSLWALSMVSLYKYLTRNPDVIDAFVRLFAIGLSIVSIYVANKFYYIRMDMEYTSGMNEIYNVLLAVPLAFLVKSKWLRIVALITVSAAVLLSMKGAALIALAIGFVVYAMIHNRVVKNKVSVALIVMLVLIIVVWIFFPVINEQILTKIGVDWGEKILEASETGGSGRFEIWPEVLKAQSQSSLLEWVIGHGYYTVIDAVHYSAHNDFLEVLYDFGLVGFAVYLSVYSGLIRRLKSLIRNKDNRAAVLGMSIAMFFCISMFSHLVIVPGLLVNCAIVWAVCLVNEQPLPTDENGVAYV